MPPARAVSGIDGDGHGLRFLEPGANCAERLPPRPALPEQIVAVAVRRFVLALDADEALHRTSSLCVPSQNHSPSTLAQSYCSRAWVSAIVSSMAITTITPLQ